MNGDSWANVREVLAVKDLLENNKDWLWKGSSWTVDSDIPISMRGGLKWKEGMRMVGAYDTRPRAMHIHSLSTCGLKAVLVIWFGTDLPGPTQLDLEPVFTHCWGKGVLATCAGRKGGASHFVDLKEEVWIQHMFECWLIEYDRAINNWTALGRQIPSTSLV